MAITDRDERVLQALGTFRVLARWDIESTFFEGRGRDLVQRRLSKLRKQGVIRSFPFGEYGRLAWTLTADGARIVGRPPHIFNRPPNRNTIPHDLACARVGLKLQSLGILSEWVSAYEIESRSFSYHRRNEHIPDAVFRLNINGQIVGPIALEMELTLKTRARIEEVVVRTTNAKKLLRIFGSIGANHGWVARFMRCPRVGI